ncbi:MAG: Jag N-terminal domain-containing protein [Clostridia bacterium]|nr:Jag N-terminal domain-containing protein [Clostridia bacterium]
MRTCEGTGKNIEQAIENALFELRASREDVDIKILSEGGFLKKAKVLVSISEDALEKYEKKDALKKQLVESSDEDFAENFLKNKVETTKDEKVAEVAPKKEEKVEKKEVKVIADDEISATESAPEKTEKKFVEKKMTGEEFLQGVLKAMEMDGEIEKVEEERFVKYSLNGEAANDLIGHHGECMLALSHIMGLVCKTEDRKKVVLNIGDYREKRQESLTALAKRIADKVAKTRRFYKFEPMDASERKIIHTALQEDDRVTTLSKGEEPRRYLIVFPKEYRDRD